ncbi:MAG: glycosyltransferase [Pseudomonadota bacterium]
MYGGSAPFANSHDLATEPIAGALRFRKDANLTLDEKVEAAQAIGEASEGLATHRPEASAKFGLVAHQRAGGYGLAGAFIVFYSFTPMALWASVLFLAASVFSALILLRLFAAFQWIYRKTRRTPAEERTKAKPALTPAYTLLVPLYKEANVLPDLVAALERLDYPQDRLDIKLLIESDDRETMDAARRLDLDPYIEIIPIPAAGPRTKPKALNYGLAFARGEFVAVYDAEDRPDPTQLNAAITAFSRAEDNLAVVQAPLFAHNGEHSWVARQFALEYAIHFGVWLPALSSLGWPLPLGGTSNHFRTSALKAIGGWDAYNVTEDADLGMRMAASGYRSAMIEPPTYEEAPIALGQWTNQRIRWIKGHLQTWLVLMRQPVKNARAMGFGRFVGLQLAFSAGLASTLLHAPLVGLTLLALLTPLVAFDVWHSALLLAGYLSAATCGVLASPIKQRFFAILTMPIYWVLQSWAAANALWELKTRPFYWRKTPHGLTPDAAPPTST